MPEKAITHTIDFNKSEQYILSIRLSTDGFSFSVYNPIRDSIIHSCLKSVKQDISLLANLKDAFKGLDFLSYTYKQVNVVVVSRRFTLIPQELFDATQAETYFYYNYAANKNEIVLHNTLSKSGAVVLYGVDKSIYRFLSAQYAQPEFYASVTTWAESFAVKSRLGSAKKMYMCVYPSFMELYAYERGHLMLLNSYDYKTTTDCTYYLLYAWKQLAMNQQVDELCISGVKEESELVEEVRRFIQHISVVNPTNEFYKE